MRRGRRERPTQINAFRLAACCLRLLRRPTASTANRAEPHFATDHVSTQLPAVDSAQGSVRGCGAPLRPPRVHGRISSVRLCLSAVESVRCTICYTRSHGSSAGRFSRERVSNIDLLKSAHPASLKAIFSRQRKCSVSDIYFQMEGTKGSKIVCPPLDKGRPYEQCRRKASRHSYCGR